jgi:hypothetical protein
MSTPTQGAHSQLHDVPNIQLKSSVAGLLLIDVQPLHRCQQKLTTPSLGRVVGKILFRDQQQRKKRNTQQESEAHIRQPCQIKVASREHLIEEQVNINQS